MNFEDSDKKNSNNPTLEEKLGNKLKFCWDIFTDDQKNAVFKFSDEYFDFLYNARIERERISWTIKHIESNGFKRLEIGKNINTLKPGDKIYYINRNKNAAIAIIGNKSMIEKTHLIGSHVDMPRLDLKLRPLFEDKMTGLVMLKTHYYGGIKKYQWGSIPLHLVGLIVKKDGSKIQVDIGKDPKDPVFTIPDILPHLAANVQGKRISREVLKGEELNILAGAIPINKNENKNIKWKFKANILKLLNEKYEITEEDLQSAELSLISGLEPRYLGFDKSMIGAAGQDDGVCSYTGIKALLSLEETPTYTAIMGLFDKEEIGSCGNTGAQSSWIQFVMNDIMVRTGIPETLSNLHLTLTNTLMLSADVGAAINPIFPSVHDPFNAAYLGKGIIIEKYTGAGGKSGSSDVIAEVMAYMRKIFEEKNVPYQIVELGKVDEGGGGTIAKYFAQSFNCDVVDIGTPTLSMHSPYEVVHIADLYGTFLAYKAFYEAK